ncbi:hypothetical protein CR511_18075 [Pseudomonas putida]|nr:hypothetical protein CR511_18075 [Pseudomonas putida]
MSQNRKRHLFYKNGQLASQIASDHAVTVLSVSKTPMAEQRSEGSSARISLLTVDLQSSVLNHSRRDSTHTLAYTAYGHSKTLRSTAALIGFTGQRHDGLTNCYLLGNGYRAFSTRAGRFLSPDTFSPFGLGGINSYAYCSGDPVNQVDPSGHMGIRDKVRAFFGGKNSSKTLDNEKGHALFEVSREKKIRKDEAAFYEINKQKKSNPKQLAELAKIGTMATPELQRFPEWYAQPNVNNDHLKIAADLVSIKADMAMNKTDPTTLLSDREYQLHRAAAHDHKVQNLVSNIRENYLDGSPSPSRKSSLASLKSTTTVETYVD